MDPYSPANRAIGITLRTAHLFTMGIYVGGVWFGASGPPLEIWRALALGTGLGLLASEVSHGPGWISQVRGAAVIAHVLALALVGWGARRTGIALAIVIGAAGSHAPKWIRKWSLREWRTVGYEERDQ